MGNYINAYISIPLGVYLIALGFGIISSPATFQGKKYVSFMGLLVILGGLAGSFSNSQAMKAKLAKAYVDTTLMRNELPIQVDEMTTMDSIRSEGGTVVIDFGLALDGGQEFEDLMVAIEANVLENMCDEPSFKTVLESGVAITMQYYPKNVENPAVIELPANHCTR